MRRTKGALPIISVEAFVATAAYGSYAKAGTALGASATTIMRRVTTLEYWMHRMLVDPDHELTQDGVNFIERALEITDLIEAADFGIGLSKARLHLDGAITIEGHEYRTSHTPKISKMLLESRADLSKAKPAPPKISAHDPEILAFLDKWIANNNQTPL